MTIIDELLVLLDDEKPRSLEDCVSELENKTKQSVSSTLGRLVGKGFIKTNSSSKNKVYTITANGRELITKTLNHIELADDSEWSKNWLFVIFNIPEAQRKFRDSLRAKLIGSGFGRVQNSLWVSARDVLFEIEDLLDNKKMRSNITVIRPSLEDNDAKELVGNLDFDWKKLEREYKDFAKSAEDFLSSKDKKSLFAQFIVYHYAKVCSKSPKVPAQYSPIAKIEQEGRSLYQKIRKYCY